MNRLSLEEISDIFNRTEFNSCNNTTPLRGEAYEAAVDYKNMKNPVYQIELEQQKSRRSNYVYDSKDISVYTPEYIPDEYTMTDFYVIQVDDLSQHGKSYYLLESEQQMEQFIVEVIGTQLLVSTTDEGVDNLRTINPADIKDFSQEHYTKK